MEKNQILVVEGDHRVSLDEIPKAMQDIGNEVLSVDDQGEKWIIRIKKDEILNKCDDVKSSKRC